MEFFIELVSGAATAVTGGGLFGLIGSLIGNWQKAQQDKARWERQEITAKRVAAEEIALQKLQLKARVEETEAELAIIQQSGAFQGLTASISADASLRDVHIWVNDVRALFRPVLTLALVAVVTWLSHLMVREHSAIIVLLGKAQADGLLSYTVTSLTFAASTAIVWWFGDRAMKPQKGLMH